MPLELDISSLPQQETSVTKKWRKPARVFFDAKDADGNLPEFPKYKHQDYPKAVYALRGESVKVMIVQDAAEHAQLNAKGEWKENPAEVGLLTAPSWDQIQLAKEMAERKVDAEEEAPRRGRPPKVAA
jgi:hypothetical protein